MKSFFRNLHKSDSAFILDRTMVCFHCFGEERLAESQEPDDFELL